MPNPNPRQTPEFRSHIRKPQGVVPDGEKLADRVLAVRVTDTIDTAIRALPEQSAWLRRVITQAAKVELLGDCPAVTPQPGGSQEPSVAASVVEVGEPSSGQIDRAELLQALDEIFKIPRLPKKALIQLQELRERLIQEV